MILLKTQFKLTLSFAIILSVLLVGIFGDTRILADSLQQATYSIILSMDFDGDVTDSSGNGLNGNWTLFPAYTTTARSGQALDLAPTSNDNYVTVSHDDLLVGADQLTISVWARKNSAASGGRLLVKHNHYSLEVDGDRVAGYLQSENGTVNLSEDGLSFIDNTDWHHYQLAYDGQQVRLVIDDRILPGTALTGTVYSDPSRELVIGKNPWGNAFDGQIDDLLIYEGEPDIAPPYIDGQNPVPDSNWAPLDTSITLHVKDDGRGVDSSIIEMAVDGSSVSPTITGSPADYTVVYDPPADFSYRQQVDITLNTADLSGNSAQYAYSFTTQGSADTVAPTGYFYVENSGSVNVVVHSVVADNGSGMEAGAQMRLSNNGSDWTTLPYAGSANWILDSASGERTIYAQYSDVDGNWSNIMTYGLGGEPGSAFEITEHAPTSARLRWQTQPGATEYVILRSQTLGWSGSLERTEAISQGDTIIHVQSTNGLEPDCQFHIGNNRDDYYINQIIDGTHISTTYPMQSNYGFTGPYPFNLSGCWVKDYSGYTEITRVIGNEFVDTGLSPETDYFYVIGYVSGGSITSYSTPINIKLTGTDMIYDAAIGVSGGYAWKVSQLYGDTPQLIDGNDDSELIMIQYNDPTITVSQPRYMALGFHRFNLNERLPVERVEILQNMETIRIQPANIRVGFDDRSSVTFDLENDSQITRVDMEINDEDYRLYRIPISYTTSYVSLYVEDIANSAGNYAVWKKVSIYTSDPIIEPVTSALDVEEVDMTIDFSRADGTAPTSFGTAGVYNNSNGYDTGWELRSWEHTRDVFNVYKVVMGDFWPNNYGVDQIKIGELAYDIDTSATAFELQNIDAYASEVDHGANMRIGQEKMIFGNLNGSNLNVGDRGDERTEAGSHSAGTPVFIYKGVGQLGRLQEVIPEFPVEKIPDAYGSGIASISINVPLTDTVERYSIINDVHMVSGTFAVDDVIRIGREIFLVLAVSGTPGDQTLTLQRGYDGTNQLYIQGNWPVRDVYKLINYMPYYTQIPNDASDYSNYNWTNFKNHMDKIIVDGNASPWFTVLSPYYATEYRGRIDSIETLTNDQGIQNNVIVDEYNSQNSDQDWWYLAADGNDINDDTHIRGNNYQYERAQLHIITGPAAGKVFFVRSHTDSKLRVVTSWEAGNAAITQTIEYVDLAVEGVSPGDIYKLTYLSNRAKHTPTMARRFWQHNANIGYNIARYIHENYADELNGQPIYFEFGNEPNLAQYSSWNMDIYIQAYNIFANTLRLGGPNYSTGFSRDQVVLGAGGIAGGLNPGVPMAGTDRDYDIALTLIEEAPILDFVSHHRYYMGSRVQKRENSWEYHMLRSYAQGLGKNTMIIDSEDSVATAGGTGNEAARHDARFGVPYWPSNFISSYYGEYGVLGRLALFLHFRLYHYRGGLAVVNDFMDDNGNGDHNESEDNDGVAQDDGGNIYSICNTCEDGDPVYDLVYWPIKLYQQLTSTNPDAPDTLARVVHGWDNYGWVQTMGTIHGETGVPTVHLVNKKDTPITVDLDLQGLNINSATMHSIIGDGSNQTIGDGFHPIDYAGYNGNGPVVQTSLTTFDQIVLEPFSVNIITLDAEIIRGDPSGGVYLPVIIKNN